MPFEFFDSQYTNDHEAIVYHITIVARVWACMPSMGVACLICMLPHVSRGTVRTSATLKETVFSPFVCRSLSICVLIGTTVKDPFHQSADGCRELPGAFCTSFAVVAKQSKVI
jgi:hypothetical protein